MVVLALSGAVGVGVVAGLAVQPAVAESPAISRTSVQRIATLDTFRLMRLLIDTPESAEIIKAHNDATEELLEPLRKQYADLQAQSAADPANAGLYQSQTTSLVTRFQEIQEARQADFRQMQARIALDAHARIAAVVDTLVASHGYSHVISAPTAAPVDTDNLAAKAEDVFGRLFFKAPAEDDLTQAVIDALGIQENGPGAAQPEGDR